MAAANNAGVSRDRRRSRLKALALLLGLLAAWIILEVPALVGWVDYRVVLGLPFNKPWDNPRNRFDPDLLHIHRPHDVFVGSVRGDAAEWFGIRGHEYPVDVHYDQNGFRNDADMDRADVVVIGDSFVEASRTPAAQLLTTRLAETLHARVLNLGQAGYGPQQERIVLERFGLPAHPRVVVWLFFEGNDLNDSRRYRDLRRTAERFSIDHFSAWQRSLVHNVGRRLRAALSAPQSDFALGNRRSGLIHANARGGVQRMYYVYRPIGPSDDCMAELSGVEDIIEDAAACCAKHGSRFVLGFVPTNYRVYRDLCRFDSGADAADWTINDLPERLRSWAGAHGIDCVDLTPRLHEAAQNGTLVYELDDSHWTPEGNRVAALALARAVEPLLHLSAASEPASRTTARSP